MVRGRAWALVSLYCTAFSIILTLAGELVLSEGPTSPSMEKIVVRVCAIAFGCSAILSIIALLKVGKGGLRKAVVIEMLVITFFIIMVVLPSLLSSKKTGGFSVISVLRTMTSAQEMYRAKWGVYGTAAQLGPDGQRLVDDMMAGMTHDTSVEKAGFFFRMELAEDGSPWCAIAWPTKWGYTGEKAFHISADGTIKYKSIEGSNPDWNPKNYPKYLGE